MKKLESIGGIIAVALGLLLIVALFWINSDSEKKANGNPPQNIQPQTVEVVGAPLDQLDKRLDAIEEKKQAIEEARLAEIRKAEAEKRRVEAEKKAKALALKEKAEKEAKLKAEKEAKLKAEKEAKLKAEKEAKLKAEKEAKLKAEKEAKLKAEKEAKLKAEKEAKQKAEKDAKIKAEKEAKLKAEKEAKLKAEKEKLDAIASNAPSLDGLSSYGTNDAISEFGSYVENRMKQFWKLPPNTPENLTSAIFIKLNANGEVISVAIQQSSGYPLFDAAAIAAVKEAAPFTLPPNKEAAKMIVREGIVINYSP